MIFNFQFYFYSLVISLLGLAVALRIAWNQPNLKLPKNQQIQLIAAIKNEPKLSDFWQVIEVGDSKIYTDLFPRYHVGDRLKIEGIVDEGGLIFKPKIEKVGVSGGFLPSLANLRVQISEKINQLLPGREATLVMGTVLGVDNIEHDFRDQLIKTGTIHVVVVSGQNLSIVAALFLSLARFIGKRPSLLLATLASFAYAVFTGFEPPVVRATLMVLASSVAIFFGREVLSLLSILLAALLIIFIWPQAISEISFQLTFAATLGIATLGQYLMKASKVSKGQGGSLTKLMWIGLVQNAAIATSAYLFTAPIILYYFGRVSLIAPLANILVVEAVSPVMILGFIIAIFSLILTPVAQLFAYIAYVPAFYFVKVVEIFSNLSVGQVSLGKGNWVMVVGLYLAILVLMWVWRRQKKYENGE